MTDYIVFFTTSNNKARTYNPNTTEYKTVDYLDVFRYKRKYEMFNGYETNDEGLIKFAIDFKQWCNEIKNSKVFKFNYFEYCSHHIAILEIFKKLCYDEKTKKHKYEHLEDIDNIEFEWIEACNNSGLQYCKKGKHQCYGYDFKLTYPSILTTDYFFIPTKKGTLQTIKELPEYFTDVFGYYKVKVISNDERFNKVWSYSKKHTYTNISLGFALRCKKLGFKVDMILIDEPNNAYIYGKKGKKDGDTGVIRSSNIFKTWFNPLSNLRESLPNNKVVKMLMSSLGGRLFQLNRMFKTLDELKESKLDFSMDYDLNHKYFVRNIKYYHKKTGDTKVYELIETKKPYKFNLARIKPFLLSYSRALVGAVALDYIDDVVRIHTDNVTFNKQHDDVIEKHTNTKEIIRLVKEDKTTGLIKFKGVGCYKHYTNDKYTTKNYDDFDEDDEEIENDEEDIKIEC